MSGCKTMPEKAAREVGADPIAMATLNEVIEALLEAAGEKRAGAILRCLASRAASPPDENVVAFTPRQAASVASARMWLQKRRLFSVPSEIIPEKEVRQLRQTLRTRSHADRSGWSTILHPALVRHAPSLPDEVRELHRKIWSSPAPDLPVEWRRELAALELRAD